MILCSCVTAHGQTYRAGCSVHTPHEVMSDAEIAELERISNEMAQNGLRDFVDAPRPGTWTGGAVQCLHCASRQIPTLIGDDQGLRWIIPDHPAGREKHCRGGGLVLEVSQ
jgi:hypothetical protein